MSDQNLTDKRRKLIDEAVAQCQETRKALELKMPHSLEQIRNSVHGIMKQDEINFTILHASEEESQKTKVIDTIQKFLEISPSKSILQKSINALLSRHRH